MKTKTLLYWLCVSLALTVAGILIGTQKTGEDDFRLAAEITAKNVSAAAHAGDWSNLQGQLDPEISEEYKKWHQANLFNSELDSQRWIAEKEFSRLKEADWLSTAALIFIYFGILGAFSSLLGLVGKIEKKEY